MGQIFFKMLAGAVAGLLAWILIEPTAPVLSTGAPWAAFEVRLISTMGLFIGLTIGGINGYIQGSKLHFFRGLILGGLFGAGGAVLGYTIGGNIASAYYPAAIFVDPTQPFATKIMARMVAITPMGTMLGLAIGASTLNIRRMIQGAVGGTLGTAIAAGLFDTLSGALGMATMFARPEGGEIGQPGRMLVCVLPGLLIALFIGIIERVARSAWLRLSLGRNEGKEWVVDSQQTFIGRSETAHVPLFGDDSIAPRHACIARQGDAYILMDGGTPVGTYLNGYRIQHAPLFNGAVIGVGSYKLEFLMRKGAVPGQAAEALRAQQAYQLAPDPQPQAMAYQPPQPLPMQPATAPQSGISTLVAIGGPLTGQRFPVIGQVEAGRETPGITLGFDGSASRRHAGFTPTPQGLVVTDFGSTNGTFVNEQKVQSTTLRPGDIVRIGVTAFRVE